jgi:hypothetical protein
MNKVIILSIFLAFVSISGHSMNSLDPIKSSLIPGKSKIDSKENKNKKKRKPMKLRLPSEQLKKDFQIF